MSNIEAAEVTVEQGVEEQVSLSRQELRNELQRFASMELQYELAKACTQLREELVKQLSEIQAVGRVQPPPAKPRGILQLVRSSSRHSLAARNSLPGGKSPAPPDHWKIPDPPERLSTNGREGDEAKFDCTLSSALQAFSGHRTLRSQIGAEEEGGEKPSVPEHQESSAKDRVPRFALPDSNEESDNDISASVPNSLDRKKTMARAAARSKRAASINNDVTELDLPDADTEMMGKRDSNKSAQSNTAWGDSWLTSSAGFALRKERMGRRRTVSEVMSKMDFRRKGLGRQRTKSLASLAHLRRRMLEHSFEHVVSVAIMLNGIFIGVQTDYQARNVTETLPTPFVVIEIIFCVGFTAELVIKLIAFGVTFYYMDGWMWNMFDTTLVILQLVEVIGLISADSEEAEKVGGINFSFVRLLRVLRLLRILRLVRLLQFIDELAVIVNSIAHSFRSLCWTVILLFMMIYMVAIVCAQVVTAHRAGLEEDAKDLEKWWGSVGASVLSLYQAIMGGVDWEELTTPMLQEISPVLAAFFCMYIAFALLAVMNVITGTFVQSAVRDAERDKVKEFSDAARKAFSVDSEDYVTFRRFEDVVDNTNFAVWLQNMQIKSSDAKLLFHIIDNGGGGHGYVEIKSMVDGLIRIRDAAKYMDLMKMMFEENRNRKRLDEWTRNTDSRFDNLSNAISQDVSAEICRVFKREPVKEKSMHVPNGLVQGAGHKQAGEYDARALDKNAWSEQPAPGGQQNSDLVPAGSLPAMVVDIGTSEFSSHR